MSKEYNKNFQYARIDKVTRQINNTKVDFIECYLMQFNEKGELVDYTSQIVNEKGETITYSPHFRCYLSDEVQEKLSKLGAFPYLVGFDKDAIVTDKEGRVHRQFSTPYARDSAGKLKENKRGENYRVVFVNDYSFAETTSRPLGNVSLSTLMG